MKMSEFWKTCICHSELDSFPVVKDFSDGIGGDTNNVIFLREAYLIMRCVNIARSTSSGLIIMDHYFPNDPCMLL